MRILRRIAAILAVALVVVGVTYAYVSSGAAGLGAGSRADEPRMEQRGQPPTGSAATQPRGDGGAVDGRARDGGAFSLAGAGALLRSLSIIALVVLIVAPLAGWLRRRATRATRTTAPPPAPSS